MTLEEYAKQIEKLRAGFLFDEHEITENMSPIAEQFFIAAPDQANRYRYSDFCVRSADDTDDYFKIEEWGYVVLVPV